MSNPERRVLGVQRPRILCVDDEPQILEGLADHLHRLYEVKTAVSGALGLVILRDDPSVAAVISDMRMPVMNGATFLREAVNVCPGATRILLTGEADMSTAVAAVNSGKIFRFLTKPCSKDTLLAAVADGVEQNRLLVSEHVLLEQTLLGSIKALTDVLGLTHPLAFGKAERVRQLVVHLGTRLKIKDRWILEVAAMMSQLGCAILPQETMQRLYSGHELTAADKKMVDKMPAVVDHVLGNIPRLEAVRELIGAYKHSAKELEELHPQHALLLQRAQILRLALDYDDLATAGVATAVALSKLRVCNVYREEYVAALEALTKMTTEIKSVVLSNLTPGMVLAEDLKTHVGALFVARGHEVTSSFIERLRNIAPGTLREPISVIAPRELTQDIEVSV